MSLLCVLREACLKKALILGPAVDPARSNTNSPKIFTFKNAIMVKNSILAFLFLTISAVSVNAQRIAYVDVATIMETIQEYQDAQKQLDELAAKWRQEIAVEYDKIKGMYNRYQAEQVLLSDEQRREKEDEIMEMEKKVRELQKQKFGPEGELFQKRKELVQPIQDKVYAAIEEYANERGYDFILDKSTVVGLIFANPSYDKTDDILDKLKRN